MTDLRHLPAEVDDYIKASIDHLVGLPVPNDKLLLKLRASEKACVLLQDQVFLLHQRLRDAERKAEQSKAEATMSALGLRKCVEEKEEMAGRCVRLIEECSLYEKDIERLMESYDEMARENEELKASRARETSNMMHALAENESLRTDKENLRINLHTAEEEVRLLFEENKKLDKEIKLLHKQFKKESKQDSDVKPSANSSTTGKRKSCFTDNYPIEKKLEFSEEDQMQPPLSIYSNSPDSRRQKKQ